MLLLICMPKTVRFIHGEKFKGHRGFDANELASQLKVIGFQDVKFQQSYAITKTDDDGTVKEYPIFMLIGQRA